MINLETFNNSIINHIEQVSNRRLWQENYRKYDKSLRHEWIVQIIINALGNPEYPVEENINNFIKKPIILSLKQILVIIQYIENNKNINIDYYYNCINDFNFKYCEDETKLLLIYAHIYANNNIKIIKEKIEKITRKYDKEMQLSILCSGVYKMMQTDKNFSKWIDKSSFRIFKSNKSTAKPKLTRQTCEPVYLKFCKRCIKRKISLEDVMHYYKLHIKIGSAVKKLF